MSKETISQIIIGIIFLIALFTFIFPLYCSYLDRQGMKECIRIREIGAYTKADIERCKEFNIILKEI